MTTPGILGRRVGDGGSFLRLHGERLKATMPQLMAADFKPDGTAFAEPLPRNKVILGQKHCVGFRFAGGKGFGW